MDFSLPLGELAWPLILFLAWVAGEFGRKYLHLPAITTYAIIGFIAGPTQLRVLSQDDLSSMVIGANIALGLLLFEAGYRINLRWFFINKWIGITGALESAATFIAVFCVAQICGISVTSSLWLSALTMATSPATIICMVNKSRSAGQITDRLIHLSVLSCVLAVLIYKMAAGAETMRSSGEVWWVLTEEAMALSGAVVLGLIFGMIIPKTANPLSIGLIKLGATPHYALSIVMIVMMAHVMNLSPILATLTFGIAVRHQRHAATPSHQGFGLINEFAALLLFTFAAATIQSQHVLEGLWIAIPVILARSAAKAFCSATTASASGIEPSKGILTGIGLAPLSVFTILLLEQTQDAGLNLLDKLPSLAAIALILEIAGPVLTQIALSRSQEANDERAA